jgi:ferredoxin
MSLKITDECTNCAVCEPECPNEAITEGDDIFNIDPELCTECVGFYDEPQCAVVCPVECCIDDPDYKEDDATLLARARKIHSDKEISDDYPSRYKK